MATYVNLKQEEADDDFILVTFEQEESHSEKDACESEPNNEPILDLDCIAAEATVESPKQVTVSRKYAKQRQTKEVTIEDVVKEHALAFLPAKFLRKCRAVSKAWEQWISSPFFVHRHTLDFKQVSGLFCQLPGEAPSFVSLDGSISGVPNPTLSFFPECVDIRATSNGLLCCQGQSGNQPYYICNPVTEQWKVLPDPSLYHGSGTGVALVFEPSTFNFGSHYELVAAVPLLDSTFLFFEIYSSRTDSWRISEAVYCESNARGGTIGDGIYIKGYAYWEMESDFVLAFDMAHERYEIISLPCHSLPTSALTEKDGHLCYLFASEAYIHSYRVEVYVTKKMELEDVVPVSHDGENYLEPNGIFRAVCFVNEDVLILEMEGQIIAHNVKEQESRWLSKANARGFTKYFPYVNSLVTVASPED